jgi:zinc transporter ZupT
MMTILILLALVTFFSTMIGGTVAVKYRKVLPYFFAFASGSLISIAFFDILPESLSIASSIDMPVRTVLTVVVISYLIYSFLEKILLTHHYDENDEHEHIMGPIGASSLVIHSFLDGVAIGTAYAVNPSVGLIVAFAVIFHDFTDGINTVTLMLKNKQKLLRTKVFLFLDALAPVIGVIFTSAVNIGESNLALLLAFFVGEFLYIGASHLLPETHKHTYWKMMLFMSFGVALIYVLTSLIP